MNNRLVPYMTIGVVVVIGILLLFNMTNFFQKSAPNIYLSPNLVRGSAVEYKGKLFTLNFQQQNDLIALINRVVPVDKGVLTFPPAIDRIVIYQFNNAPDIVLTLIGYDKNNNLIFSAPTWNAENYLSDISNGEMKSLLSKTYDP